MTDIPQPPERAGWRLKMLGPLACVYIRESTEDSIVPYVALVRFSWRHEAWLPDAPMFADSGGRSYQHGQCDPFGWLEWLFEDKFRLETSGVSTHKEPQ